MRILLIDNNAEDTAYIRESISRGSKKEFLLVSAENIHQGIQILNSGRIDVILFTLPPPGIEENGALPKILSSFSEIPVVVVTTLGNEEAGTQAVLLGARDYLVKGQMNSISLVHTIRESWRHHTLQMKKGQIGEYIKDNCEFLKKIMSDSLVSDVLPDFPAVYKALQPRVHHLAVPGSFSFFLFVKNKGQMILLVRNQLGDQSTPHRGEKPGDYPVIITDKENILFEAVRRKTPVRIADYEKIHGRESAGNNEGVCIPLVVQLEVAGVLRLGNDIPPGCLPEFLVKMKMILHSCVMNIRENLIHQQVEDLLLTDPLTGLYNKRYLVWELDREIKRVKRYRGALSLLVMDIKGFKNINNRYGYTTGDFILRKIGSQLKKFIRITDVIGRYDGNKFIAILTETGGRGAQILKNRIQKRIAQDTIEIKNREPVQILMNIKSAEYDFKLNDAKEFIAYTENSDTEQKREKNQTGERTVKRRETKTAPEAKREMSPARLHTVRIYFIEPLELISVVIDTLVKMGFESYQIDEKDKLKLLKILDKNARNVIFLCISSQNEVKTWFEYINYIEKIQSYMIQVGAFVYSKIEHQYRVRLLEKNIAVIKFSDLQQDTLAVLKKILFYFEARGRRGYVRVDAVEDSIALFTIEGERKIIQAKIHTISEQMFTCWFAREDIHHIISGRYFLKVMLRLKGIVVQVSAQAAGSEKNNPFKWVMRICSALYKNNKVSFTTDLKKETKDRLHRYIRLCLKENIKKKLDSVQE